MQANLVNDQEGASDYRASPADRLSQAFRKIAHRLSIFPLIFSCDLAIVAKGIPLSPSPERLRLVANL